MIGGNIDLSYVTSDPGMSPLTGLTGVAGNAAELTGESPFQKMMAQMMTTGTNVQVGTGVGTAAGTGSDTGNLSEPTGIGQLLAEMIFGGTVQTKLNLQNTADATAVKVDSETAADDEEPGKLMSNSLDMMLTMFDGPVYASLVSNFGSMNTEKRPLDVNELKALIGAIGTADNGTGDMVNQATSPSANQDNALNTKSVSSAHVISETIGGDGTLYMVAEINGKTVEFSGSIKADEVSADMVVKPSAQTDNTPESANAMNAAEIVAMLQNNAEESSAQNDFASEKNSIGNGLKTTEIRQTSEPKAISREADVFNEKPETGTDKIEDDLKSGAYQSQVQNTSRLDTAAVNQTAQPTEAPEAYSQIREEILSKLEQNGPTEFKMQLEPKDLGQIDIKLKLSEGKLVIDILAADSRTQALLTSQVDKLISSMGLQNVQVESVQVSQQMNSQTQDNSQSQGFTMNSAMDFSQRRQEQNRQEIFNNGNLTGTFGPQQDEAKTNDAVSRIESIRFSNHRMNYSV